MDLLKGFVPYKISNTRVSDVCFKLCNYEIECLCRWRVTVIFALYCYGVKPFTEIETEIKNFSLHLKVSPRLNTFNPFHTTVLSLYPLYTDVSRGYKKRTVVWNGLTEQHLDKAWSPSI